MSSGAEPLRAVLIRMAKLSERKQDPEDTDRAGLVTLIAARTSSAEGMDADEALTPAPSHPGYLRRTIGDGEVFVPFNLASVFPGERILSDVITIGNWVRLRGDNPFCISGSTTFLGRFEGIGDLDFCEYYVAERAGLAADVESKQQGMNSPLIYATTKTEHRRPWADLRADLEAGLQAPKPPRLMLTYFSDGGALGPLPTTSAVLVTSDGRDGAADQSFVHQEALLPGALPLRSAVSASEIGHYVAWLRGQIRKILDRGAAVYGEQAPVKALKRCLSLMLMLGEFGLVDDTLEELDDSALQDVVMDVRLNELRSFAQARPDIAGVLTTRMEALGRSEPLYTSFERAEALDAAKALAGSLLETVDGWFEEVG